MNDLIVLMGASEVHGTMTTYLRQLSEAEIEWRSVDVSDRPNQNGGGNLGYRVKIFRSLATQFAHYEKLIFSDAFDVTFYGSKEDVFKKIPKDYVLHAAEKNCYPDPSMAERITGRTPWRFANGGLAAGTPQAFLEWCEAVETHPHYNPEMLDQQFLNERVAEGSPLCRIDSETKLFYCLFGGYDELDFASGMPINTACCTFPNFCHANGKWTADEMFARYERSLNASRSLANS